MISQFNVKECLHEVYDIFQKAYRVENEYVKAVNFPPLLETKEDLIQSNDVFYGYYIDNILTGVLSFHVMNNSVQINHLCVHPDFFRKGIASALLKDMIKRYQSYIILVSTGAKNIPARKLYEGFGFILKEGCIKSYDIHIACYEKNRR